MYDLSSDDLSKFNPKERAMISNLGDLAKLSCARQQYETAEEQYRQLLSIHERVLGRAHPALIPILHKLAIVYRLQEKYDKAEPLYRLTLFIAQKHFGASHPEVATRLNYLAGLYNAKGDYAEAEKLVWRSLAIYQSSLGPQHPFTHLCLGALAILSERQGKSTVASGLYQRTGATDPDSSYYQDDAVSAGLRRLAHFHYASGNVGEADYFFRNSLVLSHEPFWPEHPFIAQSLNWLADQYKVQGNETQAQSLYRYLHTLNCWTSDQIGRA